MYSSWPRPSTRSSDTTAPSTHWPTTAYSSRRSADTWASSALSTPAGKRLRRRCTRDAVVLVFPGGDYDAFRPTLTQNVIDFDGRTGYVRSAIEAGVPIVPAVSIGGQETQLFLTRGTWLAKRLGLPRMRAEILPVTIGVPFGMSVVLPGQFSVAEQDRHRGAGADRHRRPVRRGSRRRRS